MLCEINYENVFFIKISSSSSNSSNKNLSKPFANINWIKKIIIFIIIASMSLIKSLLVFIYNAVTNQVNVIKKIKLLNEVIIYDDS